MNNEREHRKVDKTMRKKILIKSMVCYYYGSLKTYNYIIHIENLDLHVEICLVKILQLLI